MHNDRIRAIHVDKYWGELEENNKEKAKAHFTKWQKCLDANKVESIPDMFEKIVNAIKKDSSRTKKVTKGEKPKRQGDFIVSGNKKWERKQKLSREQKRVGAKKRIEVAAQKMREANENQDD